MNKRDFIVHSGSTLMAGAAWMPWQSPAQAATAVRASTTQPGLEAMRAWQALIGDAFQTHTALERPVTLTLQDVQGKTAAAGLHQFTVRLQGPRALPLQAGLHRLTHPQTGEVALYLEPVSHGEQIAYDAHFSLLA
jgi:hypothetical protein